MSADTNRVGPTPGPGRSPVGIALALAAVAVAVGVTCGPAAGALSSTPTVGTPPDLAVGEVSVSGAAVAGRHEGTVLLWPSRPYSLTTTLGNLPTTAEYRVCALTANVELNCTTTTLGPADTAVELAVPGSNLEAGAGSKSASESTSDDSSVTTLSPGARNVSVSVTRVGANETVVVSRLASLRVLSPSGDFDGDGLPNRVERDRGTDPAAADTDRDLLADGTEVRLGTNPLTRTTAVGFGVVGLFALGVAVGLLYRFGPRLVGSVWLLASGAAATALSASRSGPTGRGDSASDTETGATRRDTRRAQTGTRTGTDGGSQPSAADSTEREAVPERRERGPRADPSPPLSDEERVLELLEANDGQLPQSEIVSRTPWSKSKVSRLLARMDAQDLVVKINAGRRNVIVLPGEEPEALKSFRDRADERERGEN
ncbi:helix-turn-helix transcriptional regulator [Halorussus salinus]|uniref:helix-turn-helix transcriptional regulator n=1 Tax=Halorussus salinus TaxID=1364935 RepID=UPI001091CD5E|nr:MarR family transcriptional regulator [Halorussus salinus]